VRFKDLLGRSHKPDPEPSSGRLLTTPGGLSPTVTTSANIPAPPATAVETPKPPAVVRVATASDLPVAEAFERLLAVEQGELVPAPEPEPTPSPAPPAAGPLSDEEIDRIAMRVAERLGSSSLAADIQRIVADVSERLVREEIQRIRQAAESRQS
jgi:hypothetical protein